MKNTKFVWQCIYCRKRNMEIIKFQFDMPKTYSVEWMCNKCGKYTELVWNLYTNFPKNKLKG